MTDVNPNSRSPFVKTDGTLTKYGMDVLSGIYRALSLSGDQSVIDDLMESGDSSAARNKSLAKRVSELESLIDSPAKKQSSLERRVSALEEMSDQIVKYKSILKRLDDIESQL